MTTVKLRRFSLLNSMILLSFKRMFSVQVLKSNYSVNILGYTITMGNTVITGYLFNVFVVYKILIMIYIKHIILINKLHKYKIIIRFFKYATPEEANYKTTLPLKVLI
ncbi:hypothetical protein SAMN04488111_0311 [Lutibacter flavus]|uniref:Uncharacterized protein n=1 Tax=Lutibacter flavus TaxID=691689 RepID=A0A238VFJ6_9FLAO|nr:hypothetical protein SAMN04488111_0311 [Lutibacter flavus]